jgi:hypothetical protein
MNSNNKKEMKLEEYKKIVSKLILKVYTSQQKIIDRLNLEIIQLKMLPKKQSIVTYNQETNIFTDKITNKTFRLDHSDDDSSDSE